MAEQSFIIDEQTQQVWALIEQITHATANIEPHQVMAIMRLNKAALEGIANKPITITPGGKKMLRNARINNRVAQAFMTFYQAVGHIVRDFDIQAAETKGQR